MVTSHLLRARQVAEELRDALGHDIPVSIDRRLAETNPGAWQGRTLAAIEKNDPLEWAAYRERPESFRFPHGESLAEHRRRMLEAVRDAARTGRAALVVTHAGCVSLLETFLDGRGIGAFHVAQAAAGAAARARPGRPATRIDGFLEP